MNQLNHVAFCGGGSGGHIIPSIAIAEELMQRLPAATVSFFTSSRPIDEFILKSTGLPSHRVDVVPQPMKSSGRRLAYVGSIAKSLRLCRRQFKQKRPNVVVGMGGFASVPGVIAAWSLGIPVILFEANALLGKANQRMARFASTILHGLPPQTKLDGTRARSQHASSRTIGVPVRARFRPAPGRHRIATPLNEKDFVQLLIIGGSQGAKRLNELVHAALSQSRELNDVVRIVHQTGETDLESVRAGYDEVYADAEVRPFIDNMADEMAKADLVISRAGANSLAEIASIGLASILVPLSTSADSHQLINGRYFVSAKAAELIDETDSEAVNHLAQSLTRLCQKQQERMRMAAAASQLASVDAATAFVDYMQELAARCQSAQKRKAWRHR